MIEFVFNTAGASRKAVFYNRWDIKKTPVIPWLEVNASHKGCYVAFDDGSDLFAKITDATKTCVVTSSGIYRRADIVHVSVPKIPATSVHGLYSTDIHPYVRPYTMSEKKAARQLIKTGSSFYKISKRIKMLVKEKIVENLTILKCDEAFIADTLVQSITPGSEYWAHGKNYPFAITAIGALNGIDMKQPPEENAGEQGLIMGSRLLLEKGVTDDDENKIPTVRDIKKLLSDKMKAGATAADFTEVST